MTNTATLDDHIQGAQDQATRLHGILKSIDCLNNEGACRDGVFALVQIACEKADELVAALDTVNLPKDRSDG